MYIYEYIIGPAAHEEKKRRIDNDTQRRRRKRTHTRDLRRTYTTLRARGLGKFLIFPSAFNGPTNAGRLFRISIVARARVASCGLVQPVR